ncbi:MAG: polyhydroxyalkanoate synthesis repressor PhaR [Burkholderiales bacterium]
MVSKERLIKKYPNRRLYDTVTSTYITLSDVKQLVLENSQFKVIDAKTNEDLTRAILLQIITEEESNGAPIFSSQMLYQIIQFYGNAFQQMMGNYLEKNIQTFIEIQQKLQGGNGTTASNGNNAMFDPNSYSQFVNMQGPAIQGLMTNYLEQSAKAFVDMQQQMQKQATTMFGSFPFSGSINGKDKPSDSN